MLCGDLGSLCIGCIHLPPQAVVPAKVAILKRAVELLGKPVKVCGLLIGDFNLRARDEMNWSCEKEESKDTSGGVLTAWEGMSEELKEVWQEDFTFCAKVDNAPKVYSRIDRAFISALEADALALAPTARILWKPNAGMYDTSDHALCW